MIRSVSIDFKNEGSPARHLYGMCEAGNKKSHRVDEVEEMLIT